VQARARPRLSDRVAADTSDQTFYLRGTPALAASLLKWTASLWLADAACRSPALHWWLYCPSGFMEKIDGRKVAFPKRRIKNPVRDACGTDQWQSEVWPKPAVLRAHLMAARRGFFPLTVKRL
jgi:hypothetical protein